MLRIFIGYDEREAIAYHTLSHSILRQASKPVSITPLVKSQLPYHRARGSLESTDFSMTRFLVPYLSDYEGWSLFMDCDMLVLADINDLLLYTLTDRHCDVLVCQHDYTPSTTTKMEGQIQTQYQCKNWSSLMLFNNARCRVLTPEYVNTAEGLALHQFKWTSRHDIGDGLPLEWNWLVGEYAPNPNAKILHYTLGGPWFDETKDCESGELWRDEWRRMQGIGVELSRAW